MKKGKKIAAALIGLTVAAVGSSFVFTACGEDEFNAGPEAGFYYYETDDGQTYYVTLNTDGSISVQIDGASYSGNYTVKDGNVSLSFGDSQAANGVYANDYFTLTYNDESMLFKRVVNYTVSYDAMGGSSVDSVTVINGKSPASPQNPTRDDYAFIGWYLDADYSVAFDFGVTPITEDTKLYARWSDKLNGAAEYVVDFDLNYSGAGNELQSAKTIGGKLYNVPVPTREGYTFAGWWVSDYEQADKLTYLYNGGALNANTTLFALWQSNSSDKLATPLPRIEGDNIVWDAVQGASAYDVEVISPKGATIISRPVGATSVPVSFSDSEAGEYVIKVTATSPIASRNSETAVRYFNNKGLTRVSVFSVVEPSVLLFNAVDGAEKYTISVVCGNPAHNHQDFELGTSTYFNFASCSLDPTYGIAFTVTASAKGKASSVSETFYYNRLLDKIDNLYFDAETETVRWTPVANAADYKVKVTAGGENFVFTTDGKASVSLKGYTASDIKVSVTPQTAGYNSPEAAEYTYKRTGLYAPQGLKVEGNKLSWNKVQGATSYTVSVDGQSYTGITGEEYDLSNIAFTNDKDYEIKIRAVGGSSSVWSDSLTVQYYSLSDAIIYSGNTVTWRHVIGATNYSVRINDAAPITVAAGTNSVAVQLTKKGVNTISVRYTDDGGTLSDWQSVSVYAYEVMFDSRQGEGVSSGYYAIGDTITLPEINRTGYELNGWYNVPGAAAANGQKFDSGSKFNTVGDLILYANWASRSYTITYTTAAGETVSDKTATVDYNTSYRLAVPTNTDTSQTFVGWVDESGKQLTDSEGYSLAPWSGENTTVRASWVKLFDFSLQQEGTYKDTYAVKVTSQASRVSKIVIPATYEGKRVTIIEGYAFYRQTKLKSIDIPDSIQVIYYNEGAFEGCSSLEEVNVYSTGLTRNPVFSSYDGVLYFENEVAEEGKELVFVPAAKTGHYIIPDGVQSIGRNAFSNARITSLTIPSSVSNIASRAFTGNRYLSEIAFGFDDGDELIIGEAAFDNCSALKSLTIPARFKSFDPDIFGTGSVLENIYVAEDHEVYSDVNGMLCNKTGDTLVYCPRSRRGALTIPAGVRVIGEGAFSDCTKLTAITIPSFVTSIEDNAFIGCSKVTSVTFSGGNSLGAELTLGDGVFSGCSILNKIEFANNSNVVAIGKESFKNCNRITTINLPKTVKTIASAAFSGCGNLVNIYVDANNQAYSDDNGVLFDKNKTELLFYSTFRTAKEYKLPATVEKIGESVFENNVILERIVIGNKIAEIEANAFRSCTNLKSVVFVDGATSGEFNIGDYAFADCPSLTALYLAPNANAADGDCVLGTPSTLRKIGNYAFNGTGFKKLVFSEGLKEAGSYAFGGRRNVNATPLEEVNFPASFEFLGDNAFWNCDVLSIVTFAPGSKLKTIKEYAFYSCNSLAEITIPASVTLIEAYAFQDTNLTDKLVFESEGRTENITLAPSSLPYTLTELILPQKLVDFYVFQYGYLSTPIDSCRNLKVLENMPTDERYTYKDGVFYINDEDGNPVTLDHAVIADTNIVVPNTVTLITSYSCMSCAGAMTFEDGGTKELIVEGNAFNNSQIKRIVFPARLKSIGASAFVSSHLESVVFEDTEENPSHLEEIGDRAFASMSYGKITEVVFPRSLKRIGDRAFMPSGSSAVKISKIVLNEGLEYIGECAFGTDDEVGCEITELVIPYTVKYIGSFAFSFNFNLESITFAKGVGKDEDDNEVEIDSQIEIIGSGAFAMTGISEITLPKSLSGSEYVTNAQGEKVGDGILATALFMACMNLEDVTFEEGCPNITSYGMGVFFYCMSYTDVSFPVNLVDAGIWDPEGTGESSIKNVIIPKSFTEQSLQGMISTLSGIESFELEEGNENLHQDGTTGAIYNKDWTKLIYYPACYKQESYTVREGTKEIAANAFYENKYLKYVTLPEGLETIGDYAFGVQTDSNGRTSALVSINIPSTVEKIGNGAFRSCTKLTTVTFDKNEEDGTTALKYIGNFAFRHCSALEEIDIPDTVTSLGYEGTGSWSKDPEQSSSVFYNCAALKKVTIPNDLKDLQSHVFGRCPVLEEVVFKEGGQIVKIGMYAFANSGIQKIDISNSGSLTLIEEYAFYNCQRLTDFTFNNDSTVIELRGHAFEGAGLTELTLPANIASIGDYAFYNATSLATIIVAEGDRLERIGDYAFCNTKITSFDFGKFTQLEEIGVHAFAETGLLEISLPNTVLRVGDYAFYNCSQVGSISLSTSLEKIGDYAFAGTAITSVEVYGTAAGTSIGKSAFEGCSELETVTLNDGVDTIGSLAFAFTKVTSIVLPETILSLDGNPFAGCSITNIEIKSTQADITYIGGQLLNRDETILYYASVDASGIFVLSDKLTAIMPGVFAGTNIKSITLPDTFTVIEDGTFQNCTELTSITIGKNITKIGASAFEGCTKLETVTFEQGGLEPLSIGAKAFKDCTSLGDIVFPHRLRDLIGTWSDSRGTYTSGIAGIAESAFENSSITSVSFETVDENSIINTAGYSGINLMIGNRAFANCDKLTTVTLPDYIYQGKYVNQGSAAVNHIIGEYAFYNCEKLSKLNLPENIGRFNASLGEAGAYDYTSTATLGSYAFANCKLLTSFTAPKYLRSFSANCFNGSGVTEIILPYYTQEQYVGEAQPLSYVVNSYAFAGCADLVNFESHGVIDYIAFGANAFQGCTKLKAVVIDTVCTLGSSVFKDCTSLESAKINFVYQNISGSGNLNTSTFQGCTNLTTVEITGDVTTIGSNAFANCTSVTELIIPSKVTTVAVNAFTNWTSGQTIKVAYSEDTLPSGYRSGWNGGATVEYNYVAPSEGND